MEQTYVIPEQNLPRLYDELARLNKRAKKLGTSGIALVTSPAFTEFEFENDKTGSRTWWANHTLTRDEEGRTIVGKAHAYTGTGTTMTGLVRQWHYATVSGVSPKYDGWSLVGCLSPVDLEDGTRENMVRTVPGHTVPSVYRNRVGYCDHCSTKRKRTETFVVQHDDGRTNMVGRQCIKDFLGHTDPHALAKLAELFFDLNGLCADAENNDWLGGGCRQPECWDLVRFLEVTAGVIRVEGWVSRGKANERAEMGDRVTATADYVLYYFNPPMSGTEAYKDWKVWKTKIDDHVPEYVEEVEAALVWAKDLSPTEGEDYLYNVNLIARAGYVSRKTTGVAASLLQAYRRATGTLKVPTKGERSVSQHVGKVKDKLVLDVTCDRIFSSEGYYGTTGVHNMTDDLGNVFVWFASGSTTWLTERGQFQIQGTVKDHSEYKGVKQTILTRVKILRNYTEEERVQQHEESLTKED